MLSGPLTLLQSSENRPTESASKSVPCAHCGLPAPKNNSTPSQSFCCNGCRGAFELIRQWDLCEYYSLRDSTDEAIPVGEDRHSFDEFDQFELLGNSAPNPVATSDDTRLLKSRLTISGIHCAACLWLLEKAPHYVSGWTRSTVRMHDRSIEIIFDATRIKLSEIARTIHRLGYVVSPIDESRAEDLLREESHRLLVKIAIAGFCAANAMWLAIALYAGEFTGIEPEYATILRFAGVVLGGIAVAFPGQIFFRSAIASLKSWTPHMDLPVAIGLLAGILGSVYGLFDGSRDIYFDSIAMLVFFLLVGRWLQSRQQRRAGNAVSELLQMAPRIAKRLDEGELTRVTVDRLRKNDRVRVVAGEAFPVDGTVIDGESTVDRALLTGESEPVEVGIGDEVEAGTVNLTAKLILSVQSSGNETRLGQLTQRISDAAASRTPVVQLANRIGGWFVVIVVALALLTATIWIQRDVNEAVSRAVSLLIVACPCALALATPLAIAVSIGRLASDRVLVRVGDCLERLNRPGTIFFDKTGTLTEGRMVVTGWEGDKKWIPVAAQIEEDVSHPVAKAIVRFASERQVLNRTRCVIQALKVVPGTGLSAKLHPYGDVQLGNESILSVSVRRERKQRRNEQSDSFGRVIYMTVNGNLVAEITVHDALRRDTKETVEFFLRSGWHVGILSGDTPEAVRRTSTQIGIERVNAQGGLTPEEKLELIRSPKNRTPVVMVGDGVNDAAALAAADVGVAIRGGASASLEAAPVIIGDARLSQLIRLVRTAQITKTTIIRNFAASLTYNLVAVILAMAGWISPLVAAVLMPVSSLTVILLTLSSPTASESNSY